MILKQAKLPCAKLPWTWEQCQLAAVGLSHVTCRVCRGGAGRMMCVGGALSHH